MRFRGAGRGRAERLLPQSAQRPQRTAYSGGGPVRRPAVLGVESGRCAVHPKSPSSAPPCLRGESRRRRAACLSLVVLVLTLLSTGCEDVRHDFFPLAAGNSWIYRVKSAGRDVGTESIRVTSALSSTATKAGTGAQASKSPSSKSPRREGRATFFRVREPGGSAVWGTDRGTIVRSSGRTRSVVLMHPPFVGTGWTDEAPGPRGTRAPQLIYCKVIAREWVETPAGWFFDCVVVRREAEDRSSIVTQWFAPDVGLVKWQVARPGKALVVWELERYVLKYE